MVVQTLLSRVLCCIALVLASGNALAQYKWVAPDGSINYGDRPPTADVNSMKLGQAPAEPNPNAALPLALRAAIDKYPVTLYVAADCKPCEEARAHLSKRGVPYSEIAVRSAKDAADMAKAGFSDGSFPALLVGRQKLAGYEASAVDGLLDAAGYPKVTMLPAGYKQANLTVAASKAAKATAMADAKAAAAKNADAQAEADTPRTNSRRDRNSQAKAPETAAPANAPPAPGSPLGFRF